MDRNEIFEKVQEVLVEALGVDDDEVTPEAIIRDDLGAESIDFLDIQFRLEKEFDIKIPRGEMMDESLAQDERYVKEGKITEAGIAELKSRMPHAKFDDFDAGSDLDEMSKLFTVETVVNYVERKLSEQ
ncbi:MAG: acyl carrier protein [Planctomycetota bacterium]